VSEQRPCEVVDWAGVTWAGSLRWSSAALVLTGAVLFAASCLNPRPDDMPSALNGGAGTPQPSNPGAMLPTGDNPGIGGDNLIEEPDVEGQVPLQPGATGDPDDVSSPDAGSGQGIDPAAVDAGPDGG
jgi:hypothetical protein